MITKELIKAEIDKIQDEYLEVLYKIIKALKAPAKIEVTDPKVITDVARKDEELNWHDFVEETYGCLVDDPIERGDQGKYEIREKIE